MRAVGVVVAAAAACLLSCATRAAEPVPANPDFALFPFWQQVLTDEAAATAEPIPSPAPEISVRALVQAASVRPTPAKAKRHRQATQTEKSSPLVTASYTLPATPIVPVVITPSPVLVAPLTPLVHGSCSSERRCAPAIWLSFLDGIRDRTRREQLDAVNTFINARPYVEDTVNWGVADYWETPGEFFAHGGDCEDFAIAKYFSLVRLGFSTDDLKIVVLNDTRHNYFHAVLSVRVDGQEWLLDNQIAQVEPMASEPAYRPIYALNERSSWIYAMPVFSFSTVASAGH